MKEILLFCLLLVISVTISSKQSVNRNLENNKQSTDLNTRAFHEDIHRFRFLDSKEKSGGWSETKGKLKYRPGNRAKTYSGEESHDLVNSISREEDNSERITGNDTLGWKIHELVDIRKEEDEEDEGKIEKLVREYLENKVLRMRELSSGKLEEYGTGNILGKGGQNLDNIPELVKDKDERQVGHVRKKREASYSQGNSGSNVGGGAVQSSVKSSGQQSASAVQGQNYQGSSGGQRYGAPSSSSGQKSSQVYRVQSSGQVNPSQQGRPVSSQQRGQVSNQQDQRYRQTSGQSQGNVQKYRVSSSGKQSASQQSGQPYRTAQQSGASQQSGQSYRTAQQSGAQSAQGKYQQQSSSGQAQQRYPPPVSSQSGSAQYSNQRQPAQTYNNNQQSWQQTQQSSGSQNPPVAQNLQRPQNYNAGMPYGQRSQQGPQQSSQMRPPQFPLNYNQQQMVGGRPIYNPQFPPGRLPPTNGEAQTENGSPGGGDAQGMYPGVGGQPWGPPGGLQVPPGLGPGSSFNEPSEMPLDERLSNVETGGAGNEPNTQMNLDEILEEPKYQEMIMEEAKGELNNALAANMDLLAEEIVEGLEGDASAEIMHQLEMRETSGRMGLRGEFIILVGASLLPLSLILLL